MNVFFFAERMPESWPETPKSVSFTSPVILRRIFAANRKLANGDDSLKKMEGVRVRCWARTRQGGVRHMGAHGCSVEVVHSMGTG